MDVFFALADPTRRSILEMLARNGELSASDIYIGFPISHPAISQHLKILRAAHLVLVEKRGQQRIYTMNPEGISELEAWVKHMTRRWDEKFVPLHALLEMKKKNFA